MPTISLPEINSEVCIGYIGDSPVTFGDLGLMKGYKYESREYVFPVASRSQVSAINVHEIVSTKDGRVPELYQIRMENLFLNWR